MDTIDPVHAAGGCYCRECRHSLIDLSCRQYRICMKRPVCYRRVLPDDFCSRGEREGDQDE